MKSFGFGGQFVVAFIVANWARLQVLQDQTRVMNLELPLLAFNVKVPTDGLPILTDWICHAQSIWTTGYEGWREGLEFKPLSDLAGRPLAYHSVEVTKGNGRISILWFTVLYAYLKLRNNMTDEAQEQFKTWLGSTRR